MQVETQVLEVALPEGVAPGDEERELLQAMLEAIAAMRFEHGATWPAQWRRLEAEGWTLKARLGWCVEARRGRDLERAHGPTRDKAVAELYELTRLDAEPEGRP